jgi:hypothetical protein
MPWEKHKLLSGFLNSKVGKCQLKIVSAQAVPPQTAQMNMWRQQSHQHRMMTYHFGEHWQVRLLVWNMPVNSQGALKDTEAADVCAACALVVH